MRMEIQIVPASHFFTLREEKKRGCYFIKVKALREINHSVHDPMDPRHALWTVDGYDVKMEEALLRELQIPFHREILLKDY